MTSELEKLKQELAVLNDLFDSQCAAEQRGIEMWQEATGRDLTWPDTANFTFWLIDRLERAEEVIEIARRLGKINYKRKSPPSDEHCARSLELTLHVVTYDKANGTIDSPKEAMNELQPPDLSRGELIERLADELYEKAIRVASIARLVDEFEGRLVAIVDYARRYPTWDGIICRTNAHLDRDSIRKLLESELPKGK